MTFIVRDVLTKLKNPTLQGELSQAVLTFGFSILITRAFGITVYGQLVILYTISNFFTDVIGVRSNEVLVYYWNQDDQLNDCYFTISVLTDILLGTLISSAIYFASAPVSHFIGTQKVSTQNIKTISFYTLFLYLRGTFWGLLQAEKKFRYLALIKNAEIIFRSIIVLIGLLWIPPSLIYLINVTVISSFLSLVLSIVLSKNAINYSISLSQVNIRSAHFRSFFKYTGENFLSTLIKSGNKQIDSIIVAKFLDQGAVAIYDLVKKFCAPLSLVTNTIVVNSLPTFVENRIRKPEKIRQYIRRQDINLLLMSGVTVAFLMAIMPLINTIYRMNLTLPIFAGLIITNLINFFSWWTRGFSLAFNQKLSVYVNLYSTLCSFTLLIALTYLYGIFGLMAALIFIRASSLMIFNRFLNKYTTITPCPSH